MKLYRSGYACWENGLDASWYWVIKEFQTAYIGFTLLSFSMPQIKNKRF